ncbi:DNA (cytosine-5-)-methyltransferase [Neorhizobium sp. BT27B]|uniref:DNA (cytosine-5-)-methyltransferase n=1 Tax=Neorhizobium sp. BT27B TaxID=3142625 RepID=UPI003D2D4764
MQNKFSMLKLQSGLSEEELAERLGYNSRQIRRWDSGNQEPRLSVMLAMQRLVPEVEAASEGNAFTFIDLFAGIGGLRKAFDAAGGRCVFTSEWDKYAQQTYMANNRDNRPIAGDITKVPVDEIPQHNVLVAGIPCQPFSIAGVSKKNSLGRAHGFADETQGTLFFDVARILKHHRPDAFLIENVKNLKSHDKGKTFTIIMDVLRNELGYHVHEMVIDARHFLPQHRQRIVIVGFREEVPFAWNDLKLPPKGAKVMKDILHPEDGTEVAEGHFTAGEFARVSEKYTLTDKLWAYLQNYALKHQAQGNGFGFGLVGPEDTCRTLSARYYKDGSEILIHRGAGRNPRRLTPRECARLMGFGNDFRIPVSDTQAYKQFGNSVAVPVFTEVARIMKPHVLDLIGRKPEMDLAG